MAEPDPLPAEPAPPPVEEVAGGSYWSVSEESWTRWGAALAEEYTTLLAPPIVVGATAAGAGADAAGRHRGAN